MISYTTTWDLYKQWCPYYRQTHATAARTNLNKIKAADSLVTVTNRRSKINHAKKEKVREDSKMTDITRCGPEETLLHRTMITQSTLELA